MKLILGIITSGIKIRGAGAAVCSVGSKWLFYILSVLEGFVGYPSVLTPPMSDPSHITDHSSIL